jgi:hypothetical protein
MAPTCACIERRDCIDEHAATVRVDTVGSRESADAGHMGGRAGEERSGEEKDRRRRRLVSRLVGVAVVAGSVLGVQQAISASLVGADPVDPAPVAQQLVIEEPVVTQPEPGPRRIDRPVVVLYGDSLAWEAREHFVQAFAANPTAQVVTRTYGGTAICDWLDAMRTDAAELEPGAVVVEFSGNAATPCMKDSNGGELSDDAYFARYKADASAVLDIFEPSRTPVYFVSAPPPRTPDPSQAFRGGRLNAMYAQLADARPGAEYVDAGAAVLDDGAWTATLPCLPEEPCEGGFDATGRPVNVVRAQDGNHFCPANHDARAGVTGTCAVWSSGAYRYGTAMAAPIVAAMAA